MNCYSIFSDFFLKYIYKNSFIIKNLLFFKFFIFLYIILVFARCDASWVFKYRGVFTGWVIDICSTQCIGVFWILWGFKYRGVFTGSEIDIFSMECIGMFWILSGFKYRGVFRGCVIGIFPMQCIGVFWFLVHLFCAVKKLCKGGPVFGPCIA